MSRIESTSNLSSAFAKSNVLHIDPGPVCRYNEGELTLLPLRDRNPMGNWFVENTMVQWIALLTSNQGDVGSSSVRRGIKTNFFFRTSVYINTGLTRTKTSRSGIIHKSQPHYQGCGHTWTLAYVPSTLFASVYLRHAWVNSCQSSHCRIC